MSNDKLADALERTARHRAATEGIDPDQWRVVLFKWEALALQAHAAEAAQTRDTMTPRELAKRIGRGENWKMVDEPAQAQAQSGEWVMVPREPTEWMLQAAEDAVNAAAHCESTTDDLSAIAYKAALAAAPQQAAEPVAWMHPELHKRHPYADECLSSEAIDGWVPLYTHPQPAQDASKYQELLMAVEKKFPGESRHETALRYIRETELQSCEPKCDAAMAKESGR